MHFFEIQCKRQDIQQNTIILHTNKFKYTRTKKLVSKLIKMGNLCLNYPGNRKINSNISEYLKNFIKKVLKNSKVLQRLTKRWELENLTFHTQTRNVNI